MLELPTSVKMNALAAGFLTWSKGSSQKTKKKGTMTVYNSVQQPKKITSYVDYHGGELYKNGF